MDNIFTHEYASIFPMMSDTEFEALKADIQAYGLIEPIETYQGKIIDGRNRYKACRELNIHPTFKEWRGSDVLAYIVSKNLHRRHLNESQRAMVGARLANMKQGERTDLEPSPNSSNVVSQSDASKMLNVGTTAIKEAKQVIRRGTPELIKAVDDGKIAVSLAEKATELPTEAQEVFVQEVKQGQKPSEAFREVAKPHVANNSGNNEWYTPMEIVEAARMVLGEIDLDPASSELANSVIKAKQFYTIEDSGLDKAWHGNIWLNPPYSSDLIVQFIDKLKSEIEAQNVREAIVLVNNATETQWFLKLANTAAAVCFPTGRIKYWGPDGEKNSPLQGQAIVYIGEAVYKFRAEFGNGKIGWIATCYQNRILEEVKAGV